MNRDERLFLAASGEAPALQAILAQIDIAVSNKARSRFRQFEKVGTLFKVSLADPDDLVTIRVNRRPRIDPRKTRSLLILGILVGIGILEWTSYSLPALAQTLRYFAHECGLR